MPKVNFNHSNADGSETASVFFRKPDGDTIQRILTPTHPNWITLITYLASTPDEKRDLDHVHGLVDPSVAIGRVLQAEFGGRVTFDLYHFYLDGIPETSLLANHVREKVLNGDPDWHRLVRFLVRLDGNPSKRAKDAIWQWVEKHGVTITEDGRMVGYKGLVSGTDALTGESAPVSYHSGPNNFVNGVLYGEPGVDYHVPHRLGSVISKRRGDVDDNGKMACSTGLHVGAYSYAKTFGENREDGARYSTMGRMANTLPNSTFALVAFSPEDVVSVPEDGTADWKIRVAKYEVVEFLEEVKDVLKDQREYDVKVSAPFLPRGQEKQPSPEIQKPDEPVGESVADEDFDGPLDAPEVPVTLEVIEPEDVEEEPEDEVQETPVVVRLVRPVNGTGLLGRVVLRDWAEANPSLAADLSDASLGHQAVARKYADITTESSVRRYRKSLVG